MTTIASKHVLITGGASGIGRGLALNCAALGADVTILDLDAAGGERVAAEATSRAAAGGGGAGPRVAAYACDVGDRGQVATVAARVLEDRGPVDIVVNNAGVVGGKPLLELDDERIEATFRVNTLAAFWTTRAFLPAMIARGSGHIVTVSSAAGLIGTPRQTDYAASKHAVLGFMEALRYELRQSAPGLRTTVVCPFYIDTGMFAGVKTRFPLLLPILREDDVVEAILDAIRRDKVRVLMPFMVKTMPMMRLLPQWAFDLTADFFGVTHAMDAFTGRSGT